jgi:hypothetical protein
MFVAVTGHDAGGRVATRSWHLIAEGDDGPFIPAIPAAVLIRRVLAGAKPGPGARPALSELELADFAPVFARLRITTGPTGGA